MKNILILIFLLITFSSCDDQNYKIGKLKSLYPKSIIYHKENGLNGDDWVLIKDSMLFYVQWNNQTPSLILGTECYNYLTDEYNKNDSAAAHMRKWVDTAVLRF